MKRLNMLFLTSNFPFGRGEEFIETEIEYLSKYFDITIISCVPDFSEIKRSLPSSVKVCYDLSRSLPYDWRQLLIWLMRRPAVLVCLADRFTRERRAATPLNLMGFLLFVLRAKALKEALTSFCETNAIDIVYSYWLNHGALAGIYLKRNYAAKVVVCRAHGWDLYEERAPSGYLPARHQMLAEIDKVFCISEHGANYLRRRFRKHRDKINVSRLGVKPPRSRNPVKKDEKLYLVSCAYLSPVKRIHVLVEALARLTIPVSWTHLGGGKLEHEMRHLARGLPENVSWHITGTLSNEEIHEFYRKNPVDLFVNTSSSEGLPFSIMEAMSYGIPVAAPDVGGIKELVVPGQNGFLWPPDLSPEMIAQTIITFHQMASKRTDAMREAAWLTWKDKVNAELQYTDFAQRLLRLIEHNSGKPI